MTEWPQADDRKITRGDNINLHEFYSKHEKLQVIQQNSWKLYSELTWDTGTYHHIHLVIRSVARFLVCSANFFLASWDGGGFGDRLTLKPNNRFKQIKGNFNNAGLGIKFVADGPVEKVWILQAAGGSLMGFPCHLVGVLKSIRDSDVSPNTTELVDAFPHSETDVNIKFTSFSPLFRTIRESEQEVTYIHWSWNCLNYRHIILRTMALIRKDTAMLSRIRTVAVNLTECDLVTTIWSFIFVVFTSRGSKNPPCY